MAIIHFMYWFNGRFSFESISTLLWWMSHTLFRFAMCYGKLRCEFRLVFLEERWCIFLFNNEPAPCRVTRASFICFPLIGKKVFFCQGCCLGVRKAKEKNRKEFNPGVYLFTPHYTAYHGCMCCLFVTFGSRNVGEMNIFPECLRIHVQLK